MTRSVSYGPNGTAVPDVTALTLALPPLNFDADFQVIEEGPGKVVMTDVTSPRTQPSTIRIAQQSRPNVYAGTTIDPAVFLPIKKGTDTVIELREVWSETDTEDSSYLRLFPVRVAITATFPDADQITAAAVARSVARVVAALAAQGDDDLIAGIEALLRGVGKKS